MRMHLLAGPIPVNGYGVFSSSSSSSSSSSFVNDTAFPWTSLHRHRNRGSHRRRLVPVASSSSPTYAAFDGKNHYEVLGIARGATSAEIKRAYRLLALKFHPDVSKDSQAEEVFKIIRKAYEILSNQATRTEYNQELEAREHESRTEYNKGYYNPNFDSAERINRWDELRRHMHQRYQDRHNVNGHNPYSDDDESDEEADEAADTEPVRRPFIRVLVSALLSLFLMKTLGSLVSIMVSCGMALFDQKLDTGYKLGYVIALIFGGRGGVLLTMCLSFTSWACGKSSSGMVALLTVAFWVGSHVARYAPVPQGALLILLYMSIR